MKTKNVIEINGKRYDAHSGKLLDKPSSVANKAPAKKSAGVKSIDGFHPHAKSTKKQPVSKPTKPAEAKVSHSSKKAHQAAPNLRSKTQRSKTLHRGGVLAPSFETLAPQTPAQVTLSQPSSKRLERALKISKSSVVQRFSSKSTDSDAVPTQHQAVKEQKKKDLPVIPAKKETAKESAKLAPSQQLIKQKQPHKDIKQEAHHAKKHRKHISFAGFGATAAAVLLLAAYVAYLNVPSISMKVAANRAGFGATLPGYKPSGYSLKGPINYAPGLVTINYHSNTDDRAFSVSQRPTTWDSEALKENFVSQQAGTQPLTYQDRGLTIYVYDDKAAWVNGSKLYAVDAKGAQLGTDQILKLAASM